VAITIVELNYLFSMALESKEIQEKKIKELYTQYINTNVPNTILMDSISSLYNELFKVKNDIFNLENNVKQICKQINS
jgi:hypothetical protein